MWLAIFSGNGFTTNPWKNESKHMRESLMVDHRSSFSNLQPSPPVHPGKLSHFPRKMMGALIYLILRGKMEKGR